MSDDSATVMDEWHNCLRRQNVATEKFENATARLEDASTALCAAVAQLSGCLSSVVRALEDKTREVTKRKFTSTTRDDLSKSDNEQSSISYTPKRSNNHDMSNAPEILQINSTIKDLKRKIESTEIKKKIHVKRNYKLTEKMPLNLWLDYLNSELKSNDLLDVIKTDCPNLDPVIRDTKMSNVRDIIINHLDDKYHNKIIDLSDPRDILKKITEFSKAEINLTESTIRAKIYKINKEKKESANDYINRFDGLIREFNLNNEAQPFPEAEMIVAFYEGAKALHPELTS